MRLTSNCHSSCSIQSYLGICTVARITPRFTPITCGQVTEVEVWKPHGEMTREVGSVACPLFLSEITDLTFYKKNREKVLVTGYETYDVLKLFSAHKNSSRYSSKI